MKLIRNAAVYRAAFPDGMTPDSLSEALSTKTFSEPSASSIIAGGFVPIRELGPLVQPFPGGFAVAFRIDQKKIPASAVNAKVTERARSVQQDTGRKPGSKMRKQIREDVISELAVQAIPTTTITQVYYHEATKTLVVPASSQRTCDTIMTALVQAVGSIKTSTVWFSGIKQGLTTRLTTWLDQQEAEVKDESAADPFEGFHATGKLTLKAPGGRSIAVSAATLYESAKALREAITVGCEVTQMRLCIESGETFTLTEKFQLRGLDFIETEGDEPPETDELAWEAAAAYQSATVASIISQLCQLLGFDLDPKEDEQGDGLAA